MPTPAEPITQQLIAAVTAAIGGMTAGATYWYTPGEILTDSIHYSDAKVWPSYAVLGGNEAPDAPDDNEDVHEAFAVTVKGWVSDHADRLKVLRRCVADLKKLLAANMTWGGLAVRTSSPAVRVTDPSALEKPFGYFELTFTIYYDRRRTAA